MWRCNASGKTNTTPFNFSCSEELTHFSVPPLLLLPFVENAFKHVSHFSDKENLIKIDLDKKGHFFRFSVVNTKDNAPQKSENGGIGLKNVTRRLETPV
jgi:two-component system LytT family sensor kinase